MGDVLFELYREKGEALMSGRFMPSNLFGVRSLLRAVAGREVGRQESEV